LAALLGYAPRVGAQTSAGAAESARSLKVLVIAGGDAANILKGKKAESPVVEVRDEWGYPVAGALVGFTLPRSKPGALFAHGKTVDQGTTDAAGRAVAGYMRPVGQGAFTIRVEALYRGQTAALSFSQTNYSTADAARGAVKLPAYANAMSGGKKALVGVLVAGGAAAGVAAALQNKSNNSNNSCTSLYNTFSSDLNIADNTTPVGSSQWVINSQAMFSALGSYCSCAGGLGVLASDPTLKQDVLNLISAGSAAGFVVPFSCGGF